MGDVSHGFDRPRANLLVTDLDNTLWDWVEIWFAGFEAMLNELVLVSGVSRHVLESEIQVVFQTHHTSEYAFLIEEVPSLIEAAGERDAVEVFASAIEAHVAARREVTRLYPGVMETLTWLKENGCGIVAYTESMQFYTMRRLKKLGLDGVIDVVYSPEDHATPDDLVRHYADECYEFERTQQRHTLPGELKPNSGILRQIIDDVPGASPGMTVYLGDSLMKDVKMAQDAGVLDVHAEYGTAQHTEAYEVLRRVTHWTKEEVERERRILLGGVIEPTHVLDDGIGQLLDKFAFEALPDESRRDYA